jgi:hypothetical protein
MYRLRPLAVLLGLMILVSLACSMPVSQDKESPGLRQTSIAIGVQQTSLAIQKATLEARPAPTAVPAPTNTPPPPVQPTKPQAAEPNPVAVQPSPTTASDQSGEDIEARIRTAKVLVFEDMRGNYARKPLVHQAVSEMGFSGGRVIEVGDALGKFKEQLINSVNWDLIIVAAEWRTAVQGEFWQYVSDQVNRGAAVVIEVWYLDKHYSDIQPLLNQCGVEFQRNWERNPGDNVVNYAIYWLEPDHPYFQDPQAPVSLGNPNYLYWVPPLTNDAGDLIQLGSNGDAVMLAGLLPKEKSRSGVMATCLGGRMILQTFSSHDYKPGEVVNLWKNSMRYTLTNHFLTKK